MSDFVVSALKYRPKKFSDVVGQEAVTKTLENAIATNKIPNAMIFCGPRGVGKTTCARIFANEINKHQNNDLAFNIFELDAASNNSVSDIRNLIEQVRIPPQTGKFKVFIIDEVHMLSQTAFNAFLKTLEEPPKHVVFILATTEKEKIIPTILSRCQIFDFKRIKPIEVKSFLISIAEKEKIKFEEGAIDLISQKSDGAMRDGLSIFDRMVTFTNSNLNSKDVSLNLNLLDKSTYVEICEKLFIGDFSKPIIMFNDLISNGFDGFQFIDGLCRHIRDLIMCHDISTADLLDLDSKTKEKIILQSKNKSKEILLFALDISNEYSLKYKTSINPNLQVELCLMQIASIDEEKKKNYIKPFDLTKNQKKTDIINYAELNTKDKDEINNKKPIKINISGGGVSELSISSIKYKSENKTIEKNVTEIKPSNNLIIEEELKSKWMIFLKEIIKKGEKNLAALLQLDTPRLKNKIEVHINVPNQTNKIELEKNSVDLVRYLKKELKNDYLILIVNLVDVDKKKFIYTSEEKYNNLKMKNPEIEKYKKNFFLEY